MPEIRVRELDPHALDEVTLVARRMRQTLVEVLGPARGEEMYTLDWLRERVLWHLEAATVTGQVYLAEDTSVEIVGHTIVRLDNDEHGQPIGLFSTIYVDPTGRRRGVGSRLIEWGERWMRDHGMTRAVTYTDKDNVKLQALFGRHGYALHEMPNDFVALTKALGPSPTSPHSAADRSSRPA